MNTARTLSALALITVVSAPAFAQAEASCILAGRISDTGRWAPLMEGVELLGQDGQPVVSTSRQALLSIRQARLSAPALLSRCDRAGTLAQGPDSPEAKGEVPALTAGVVTVEAVHFPKLRRGGELVELQVTVPAERVTMVTRYGPTRAPRSRAAAGRSPRSDRPAGSGLRRPWAWAAR